MNKIIRILVAILLAMATAAICVLISCNVQPTGKSVDLGLPSGTLWADRNVGAALPEGYGDYFAWGESIPKSTYYNWVTYKYAKDDPKKLMKYCSSPDYSLYALTDGRTNLESSDDAATANWGSNWCMPTQEQFQELIDNCTWTWTTRNGKNGYEVKGKNGNSIFLPAAGYRSETSIEDVDFSGYYWSSSFNEVCPNCGCGLCIDSGRVELNDWTQRCDGWSVRPVRCK